MMTRKRAITGYYVTAIIDGGTANQLTSYLCGPFDTYKAAFMMVPAVRHAANETPDPRFAFAAFGVTKRTRAPGNGRSLPPGRLDLTSAVDEIWIARVITPYTIL